MGVGAQKSLFWEKETGYRNLKPTSKVTLVVIRNRNGMRILLYPLKKAAPRVRVIEVNIIYKSHGNYRIGCTNKLIEDTCIKSFLINWDSNQRCGPEGRKKHPTRKE